MIIVKEAEEHDDDTLPLLWKAVAVRRLQRLRRDTNLPLLRVA